MARSGLVAVMLALVGFLGLVSAAGADELLYLKVDSLEGSFSRYNGLVTIQVTGDLPCGQMPEDLELYVDGENHVLRVVPLGSSYSETDCEPTRFEMFEEINLDPGLWHVTSNHGELLTNLVIPKE